MEGSGKSQFPKDIGCIVMLGVKQIQLKFLDFRPILECDSDLQQKSYILLNQYFKHKNY